MLDIKCGDCGKKFDVVHLALPREDKTIAHCPFCGSKNISEKE